MKRTLPLVCSMLLGTAPTAVAQYDSGTRDRVITTSGSAEMKVKPDLATFYVGTELRGYDIAKLQAEAARRSRAVVGALKKQGVLDDEIRSAKVGFQRIRTTGFGEGVPSDLEGEPALKGSVNAATNVIRVQTSKVDSVGGLIDAAVGAGANAVQGPYFGLKDDRILRDKLALEAYDRTRSKAEAIARRAGLTITGVSRITDTSDSAYQRQYGVPAYSGMVTDSSVGAFFTPTSTETPVLAGEVTLLASVTAAFTF